MARLPPPVTMITCSIPLAIASSTPYWIVGLSTSGSISFGCALVTGRKRVPRPAAGKIALRMVMFDNLSRGDGGRCEAGAGGPHRAGGRRTPHHDACWRQRRVRDGGDDRLDGGCEPQGRHGTGAGGPELCRSGGR